MNGLVLTRIEEYRYSWLFYSITGLCLSLFLSPRCAVQAAVPEGNGRHPGHPRGQRGGGVREDHQRGSGS